MQQMTTRQTTAAATTAGPSEDIPSRMDHLEAQIQEVKDLLVILSASQTRIPSTPPVDAPIPTVEATAQRTPLNEDHYLTDVSRRALIWGTTTGLAKTYLEPQYLSATHRFRSAEEMMDLLGSYYLTGNETEQARNLFNDLQMGEKGHASEIFPEFKARFQSAAITGQVSESEWFRYMWNKLTPQFRSHVTIIKNQWNGEYQTMIQELTAFDQERRGNNELNLLPALTRTSTCTTDMAKASSASKPTRATSALFTRTAFLPKPAIPERLRTAVPVPSGNCFKCGKPGHFQDKCPLNATIKELDRNDPEAKEQWKEAMELQSEASLEENDEA
ncbi:hypothetical protein GMDG_03674 [Pseudogymnoascus destructans 20631-21]|uniref:CCHC-type domain-containing protein n=1 Tax=Pseudogymnoascus destructans (strain ATCC MYA-4855 / 20631-21) TaxID=658429 RepID=L8G7B7_PSED2|nr:hypothetical protein GMDG_03674 [Pseudogymnoascus destructans 20631-21]